MSVHGPELAETSAVSVEALELFVEVLSRSEPDGSPGDVFYDRLCDAVCRLAHMRRAVIFRYDSASRRVRAAGAYNLDLERFAGAHVTVESAPIAARALACDQVVEMVGDLRAEFPPEFAGLLAEPVRLVCAPMLAARRQIGVILADRPLHGPDLTAPERHLLWTLGKAAALAAVSRIVVTQSEQAKQLQGRIDLAREIHEGVIQRLFGVSMALDGEGDLAAAARARCAQETQAALSELRAAIQRPLGRAPRATAVSFLEEVERLSRQHASLGVRLIEAGDLMLPDWLEPLAQSVLVEAVRNAQKHASPTRVEVRLAHETGAFVLEVVNDGVNAAASGRRAGMGLRLAAFEALQLGGVVEFGARDDGRWEVKLVVPDER
jgi:signal transduction histidine kinase